MILARFAVFFSFLGLLIIEADSRAETLTAESQKRLLKKADDWGVPQPKAESRLRKEYLFDGMIGEGTWRKYYGLGFVESNNPRQMLRGFELYKIKAQSVDDPKYFPDPNKLSVGDIAVSRMLGGNQCVNDGLITGIQLLRRGDEKLGVAMVNKALASDTGHSHSSFHSPAGESPTLVLARSCLANAVNQITSANPDFPKIKERIEQLIADEPKLKSQTTDWLMESLALSVAHQPAPEGSIEQVIDNYLLGGGMESRMSWHEGFTRAEAALIKRGFEAIPALLEQRSSKRFTNHLMQGFNNFPSYPMTADQVILGYLQRLANDEFGSNWLERQNGSLPNDDAIVAWWAEASAMGEVEYIKKNVTAVDDEDREKLSEELLYLAEKRHPELLPEIYENVIKTSLPSEGVLEAIMRTLSISDERKIELLAAGIATNRKRHQTSAFEHLEKIDPELAEKEMLEAKKHSVWVE